MQSCYNSSVSVFNNDDAFENLICVHLSYFVCCCFLSVYLFIHLSRNSYTTIFEWGRVIAIVKTEIHCVCLQRN